MEVILDSQLFEWIEKAKLICQLSAIKRIECVVPMHLSGGAYVVYQQLTKNKKTDFTWIKNTLYMAFALDSFTAWKQLVAHRLCPGETVNVLFDQIA